METKVCTKCGKELPIEDFYKDKQAKDGRRTQCISCTREAQRKYRDTKTKPVRCLKDEKTPALNHSIVIDTFNLKDVEREVIKATLSLYKHHPVSVSARTLGIQTRTLYTKIEEYNINMTDIMEGEYVANKAEKTLKDYTPRELLKELWDRGYDGNFFTYVKQEMSLSKLFNEDK